MAETVHLYFRAGAEVQRLPIEFTAPGDVAGMNFTEVSGLTIEAIIARSRKLVLRAPLTRHSITAIPVLRTHLDSQQPIAMALCTNEVLPSAFRPRLVNRIEDHGSHFMVEISGVNAGY